MECSEPGRLQMRFMKYMEKMTYWVLNGVRESTVSFSSVLTSVQVSSAEAVWVLD